ncbi:hypothetical protein EJ04DRAFT_481726 [Polyplosphaeria fusca]|uniref:CFEM domain-containing protein n=1 Tax=Polyplosphaeria fusca TaxID=682080 RepID=A0A9P4V8R2_9PLEO|nr:hypothetical protein EJ04DRAFT_481726 [Polyplosphaeria fusca]
MKSSQFRVSILLSALFLASLVSSQGFTGLPACATKCIESTYSSATCDPFTDSACACSNTASYTEATQCFTASCIPKEAFTAYNITDVTCGRNIRDKSGSYRNIILAFFILAVVAFAGRYAAQAAVGRFHLLDDVNMAIGFVANAVLVGVCIKMSYLGLGHDIWKVPFKQVTETIMFFWISEFSYMIALGSIKIAFLLFFLQIFPRKEFRKIVWGFIAFHVAFTIASACVAILICLPVSSVWKNWDGEHKGKCIDNNAFVLAHAAFGIVTDLITLSLPVSQILGLQLGTKKKIGVLLMFGVGAFVTVVSILRLRAIMHFAKSQNFLWDNLEASLWSVMECEVGIVCICMPSLRLGLARLFPRFLGSTAQKSASKVTTAGRLDSTMLGGNTISVQTSFQVSRGKKPQTDEQGSFVQLVEIDGDAKSTGSKDQSGRSVDQKSSDGY